MRIAWAVEKWLLLHAEPLYDQYEHAIRKEYLDDLKEEEKAKEAENAGENGAAARAKKATKARVKSGKAYESMQAARKTQKGSLMAKLDDIYLANGANREHYHGGKFDGGSCRNLMAQTKELYIAIIAYLEEIYDHQQLDLSFDLIRAKIKKFERAMALLELVWSSVRGIEGLLPTDEFVNKLDADIKLGKEAWLDAGLNIKGHPKAHLAFDGHLLDQVKEFGGLADKGEDWVEHWHQAWKQQKERTWNLPDFERQQRTQLENIRLKQSFHVKKIVDDTDESRKRKLRRLENGGQSLKEVRDIQKQLVKQERREGARDV